MKGFLYKNRKILVFTSVAMLFLIGIAAIQLVIQRSNTFEDVPVVKVDEKDDKKEDKTEEVVAKNKEVLRKPTKDEVTIVRYFYDPSYDDKKLENAMVYFEGVYRPNLGVDFVKDGNPFDVIASFSGTVTKKTSDPLLGWVVTISNEDGLAITYQSLSEVKVEKDAKVKQGDIIGVSGENVYEADLKNHLHFVVEKDKVAINPEVFFDKPIQDIMSSDT
jgi:stage II sporulation protein Q